MGIKQAFCVTGGSAAHLMEALRKSNIKVIHNYHEQACVMAADGYFRISKRPSLVLVTNGPGVSNSLTGVLGAYQDSIPMVIVSGQVPLKHSLHNHKSKLRQLGIQEVETIELVKSITKSAVQVSNVNELEKILNESWDTAVSGRPGPVWIEVPLDVQAESADFLKNRVEFSSKHCLGNYVVTKKIKKVEKKLFYQSDYLYHWKNKNNKSKNNSAMKDGGWGRQRSGIRILCVSILKKIPFLFNVLKYLNYRRHLLFVARTRSYNKHPSVVKVNIDKLKILL